MNYLESVMSSALPTSLMKLVLSRNTYATLHIHMYIIYTDIAYTYFSLLMLRATF